MHTEMDVPNPKYELVPGMYATVQIPLHTVQNVLTVPVQAVQSSGEDGAQCWSLTVTTIEKRDVTLGLQTRTDVEIMSGLTENEMVVFGEQANSSRANWCSQKSYAAVRNGIGVQMSSFSLRHPYFIVVICFWFACSVSRAWCRCR